MSLLRVVTTKCPRIYLRRKSVIIKFVMFLCVCMLLLGKNTDSTRDEEMRRSCDLESISNSEKENAGRIAHIVYAGHASPHWGKLPIEANVASVTLNATAYESKDKEIP